MLLRILKRDRDFRMKAVAARCLGSLRSDPRGEATIAMARLIQAGGAEADDTFAREVVIALGNIAGYRGQLPREGVLTLMAIAGGRHNGAVRQLARETLARLGKGN